MLLWLAASWFIRPPADQEQLGRWQANKRIAWVSLWLVAGLAAVAAIVWANQVGSLEDVKAALRTKTSLFLFLYLAIVGISPLTYLAYRAFGETTHQKRLQQDFMLLGLADQSNVIDLVGEEYRTHYSPLQFMVFIGLISLVKVMRSDLTRNTRVSTYPPAPRPSCALISPPSPFKHTPSWLEAERS